MTFALKPIFGAPIPIAGERMLIGSGESCEVRPEDSRIIDFHCQVLEFNGEYTLQDLSRGNTKVNGIVSPQVTLKHGDVITVGKTVYQFVDEALSPLPFPESEAGVTMLPASAAAAINESPTIAASPQKEEKPDGIFFTLKSNKVKKACFLPPGKSIIIGRHPEQAHFILNDDKISRTHCSITNDGGVLKIKDLGSSNGSYVNDKKASSSVLKHGDKVGIGSSDLRLNILDSSLDLLEELGIVLNIEPPLEGDPAIQFTFANDKCAEGISFKVSIKDGEEISMGRLLSNSITLKHDNISKSHCKITNNSGVITLTDSSTNGMKINTLPLKNSGVVLNDSDLVSFGDKEIYTFRINFINLPSSGAETELEPVDSPRLGHFTLEEPLSQPPAIEVKGPTSPPQKPWWEKSPWQWFS